MSDILKNIWPDWKITEKLGSGAFGTVYSAKKEDGGHIYESAIKVIHIPQDDAEVRDLRHSGMDYQSICGFYRNVKEGLRNEISVMETLRTAANIVSIDDYKEVQADDGIGWTMYIRMEKLTSLNVYMDSHRMTLDNIVKLGQDMCSALVCCEKENIIHRDIKPDNVFVNKYGDFKLGDFGIARQMEKTQSVRSQKGTYQYMAPEVYRGESYNRTADIYSLGIMLYRMLNDGRFPFAPAAPQPLLPDDNERALSERMQGKDLPDPSALAMFEKTDLDMGNTDRSSVSRLVDIVLKACSYRAEDRYQSASEMAEKLRKWVIRNENKKEDEEELTRKQSEPATSDGYTEGAGSSKQPPNETENNKKNVKTETFNQDEGTVGYIGASKDKNDQEPAKAEDKPELKKEEEPQSSENSDAGTALDTEGADETSEILNDSRRHAKKKRAKIIAIVLTGLAVIVIGIFMYIYSDSHVWNIDNGVLVKYRGSAREVEVPAGVTSIGEAAFKGCSGVTSITIPAGVTSIGNSAFFGCGSLTSITIPDSVTSVGNYTFDGCGSLTSVTIPESVTSIGDNAFYECSSLTSIMIPDGVTSIGADAFSGCSSLTSITIPVNVTSIGDEAFKSCNSLTSITIPENVTSIGDAAFSSCSSLTSVTIPESETSIGDYTFLGCSSLTSITIPDGVTSIGADAFSGCSSLTSITIPESVTSIGAMAFSFCRNLTSIAIPESVTTIGNSAFSNCNRLTNIAIPEGVTSIGDLTFDGCSNLTSITIPESVTSIGYRAFHICCNLTSITIPENVTSIGDGAFYGCSSLKNITIPESVTRIVYDTFYGCSNLTIISSTGSYAESYAAENNIPFEAESDSTQAVNEGNWEIENGELKRYRGADSSIVIPNSVTCIGDDAFAVCDNLTSITIPESVTSITIPESVTSIGNRAFYICSNLTSITIPASVTSIGDNAFYECSNLTIISSAGSYAESYAADLNIPFQASS